MAQDWNMRDYEETRRNFRLEVPETYNFGFDVIDRSARENNKMAFVYATHTSDTVTPYSFDDVNRAANRCANLLLKLGVKKGDHAIVVMPRIPAWYEVLIGCIKLGVVPIPGTTLLTAKDLDYRINRSHAQLVIVTPEHCEKIEEVSGTIPSIEHRIVVGGAREGWTGYDEGCAAASDELDRGSIPATRSDETMMIYFTSGTTAFPKMVPRDHAYAAAHRITASYWMDLKESDVHWTLSDTGWAKAAWGMLFAPWQVGAAMVLYDAGPGFDADAHLKLIEKLKVTTFCAPPTIYRLFAQIDLSAYDLSSMRHSLSAGEPLNPEALRVWREATGRAPHDGYGQTESVNLVANYPCVPIRPGSMGKPVPGMDIQIIDEEGAIRPDHEIGQIAVRLTDPYPPGLFHGYFDDEEANTQCFRHGFYYTGDTGMRDEDGYIWFVGRSDDLISSAGYRISPFEVESALAEHPAIVESAVVGKRDELRGELVKAYVVLADGFEPSETLTGEIQDFVKSHTAPYKYPREIEFRAELPKTISGKIRRVDLRAEANEEEAAEA